MSDQVPPEEGKRDASGRWLKGYTGNRGGRPKGAGWVASTRALLREKSAIPVLDAMHKRALAGDVQAARLLLERVLAPVERGDDSVSVRGSGSTIADQARAITAGIVSGKISPAVGAEMLQALRLAQEVVDSAELAARLEELEARVGRAP